VEWVVEYDEAFTAELDAITRDSGSSAVLEEVLALAELLRRFGPHLKRPHCDTLSGSKHANMKELRFKLPDGDGVSPSPSIHAAALFCWSVAVNREHQRSASIVS
jgi:hypothetical protein